MDIKDRFKKQGTTIEVWAAKAGHALDTAYRVARKGWAAMKGDKSRECGEAMSTFLGDETLEATFGKKP